MDVRTKSTIVFRGGTLLVAIAFAFGLISYMSSLTVSGYRGDQCLGGFIPYLPYSCGNLDVVQAGTFTVLYDWSPASPQQMYFLNMSSAPTDAEVYLLATNLTDFSAWVAGRSGLPPSSVSPGSSLGITLLSDYVASHNQEVVGKFDVTGAVLVVRHFVPDVTPLMAVVANGNDVPLNFTYFGTNVGVMINPDVGYQASGYVGLVGAVLGVLGFVLNRHEGKSGEKVNPA